MNLTSLLAIAAGAAPWSPAAAPLEACPASGPPRVVFPSNTPRQATGPGAIVWDASPGCPGGEGARVAAVGAGDTPGMPAIPRTAAGQPIAPGGPLTVSAAPHGQIAVAGASPGSKGQGLLIQGRAGGPFSALWSIEGPSAPLALTTAYLGDIGVAFTPAAGRGVGTSGPGVRVERYYSNVLSSRLLATAGTAHATNGLALALDYRTDALTVWAQGGVLYAHDLPASGTSSPTQRLAHVGAHVRISALLSDDNRATVAWAEDDAGQTSVYIDRSAARVRFGLPRLLERFRDPDGLASPPGSPSLVRLSTESVMLAWAGAAHGRWVVRTAAVNANGVGNANTIGTSGTDALLASLAPGPNGEALALWTEPQQTGDATPDMSQQAIFSARGIDGSAGRTLFGAPEQVAAPGLNSNATVALDPGNDRAIAAWRGAGGEVHYAIRGTLAAAP